MVTFFKVCYCHFQPLMSSAFPFLPLPINAHKGEWLSNNAHICPAVSASRINSGISSVRNWRAQTQRWSQQTCSTDKESNWTFMRFFLRGFFFFFFIQVIFSILVFSQYWLSCPGSQHYREEFCLPPPWRVCQKLVKLVGFVFKVSLRVPPACK